MCMGTKEYTTIKFAGIVVGSISRVIRSFLFNLLLFALGFGCGYVYVVTHVEAHLNETQYECIQDLDPSIHCFHASHLAKKPAADFQKQ